MNLDAELVRLLTENPTLSRSEAQRLLLKQAVQHAQKERDDEFAAEIAALFGQAYVPEQVLQSLASTDSTRID